MPRAERPIDAEETELGTFAADLRRLREKAGKPAYRELASRAHYSTATLADAASGRKLPTLAVTLAYVGACGGDTEEWEKRWRLIASPPDATDDAPYVGLTAFQPQDADRFFGRENLTRKLEGLVAAKSFVGVVGPSGSGKSSLLRAGLVPRLGSALVFTPGALPADECAVRLAQLTGESAVSIRAELDQPTALGLLAKQHDVVLVIDQFEEVFTLCDTEQRDWLIHALTSAPRVVVGIRADFYGHVIRRPELVEALDGAQLLVGPMTADELRRAITEPANRVGATVETALVTRLVADVAGQPAALPLVQHALVETWHRRRGMTLTLAGYVEAGGVEHAIARTAETVFSGLSEEQQVTAKQIFLRLIALGEGTEDTKRRANRAGLDDEVLERLAAARLVSLSENHVELSHEALIRSWPRLRDWIAEDRETLRIHHQLAEAAAGWDGHDHDLLYKGVRLAQANELQPESLTEPERAFLTASQADGRRRARRTRAVFGVLSVLVVFLAGTVLFAVRKADDASRRQNDALAGRAVAEVMRLIQTDPAKAGGLALAAYAAIPSSATRDAMLNAGAARWSRPFSKQFASVPDPKRVALLSTDGEFFIEATGTAPATIWSRWHDPGAVSGRIGDKVHEVVLSRDDRRAFTVEDSGGVQIWDIADLTHPKKLGVLSRTQGGLTVNRDGTVVSGIVLGADGSGQAVVWDLRDAAHPREIILPRKQVISVVVGAAGREAALVWREEAGEAVFAEIWDVDGQQPRSRSSVRADGDSTDVKMSDSGRYLMVLSKSKVAIWDVVESATPMEWGTVPHASPGHRAHFAISDDEKQIAVENNDTVEVWDISTKGAAVLGGAFGGFRGAVYGLRYREREKSFNVVDSTPSIWSLRTDLQKVKRELCTQSVPLSGGDWAKYFPDVERVPVC